MFVFALICVGGFLTVASHVGEQRLNPVAFCIKSPVTLVLQVEMTEPVLHLCNRAPSCFSCWPSDASF